MAAAIVDIEINEGETFDMSLEFWGNSDLTDIIDISTWTFKGAMKFSNACIPMSFIKIDNSVNIRIEANALVGLPSKGTYTIEATDSPDTYRIQQGSIAVDKGIVCM